MDELTGLIGEVIEDVLMWRKRRAKALDRVVANDERLANEQVSST